MEIRKLLFYKMKTNNKGAVINFFWGGWGGGGPVKFHKGGPKNINPLSISRSKNLGPPHNISPNNCDLPQNGIGRYSICSNMEVNLNT